MSEDNHDERIDELADRFEAAWKSGRRISANDFLAEEPMDSSLNASAVLNELRRVEQELHQKYRKSPSPGQSELKSCERIGSYEIFELIGQGGMGKLYRARHVLLDKIVAIKVLPQAIANDPLVVERFNRELKLIGNLSHPNIVQAHGAEHFSNTLLLAMEFVEGESLQQIIASGRKLPIDDAIAIIRQVAAGLQHAYEQKRAIIHRDIKPANIMVTRDGVAKILDFGLGKFHGEMLVSVNEHESGQLTQQGSTIGTVDFLSPEQWDDPGNVDIRTDIYGLGCTFYTIVVGEVPYPSDKFPRIRDKMIAHLHSPMPSFAANGINVSPMVEAILQKMCAKDCEARFATPKELLTALDEYQRSITGVTPVGLTKSGFRRRHLLLAGGIAAAGVLGLHPLIKSFLEPETTVTQTTNPPPPPPPPPPGDLVLAPVSDVLTHRYRGDLFTARRLCREWIDEVVKKAPDTSEQREQCAITHELLADCALYSDPNVRAYEFYAEEAEELYFQAIDMIECPEKRNILSSKRAIVQMVSGNPSAGLRTLEVGTDRNAFEANGKYGEGFLFYETAKGIGNFYCAETYEEQQNSLYQVLERLSFNTSSIASQPSDLRELELLDLQLLCVRQLLETALKADSLSSTREAQKDYLDPILFKMAVQEDRRPYLRKYFDLAIRCNTNDLLKQAKYIYAMRGDYTRRAGLAQLLFYFTDKGGFAIFLPNDLSDGVKFDLAWTREELRLNRHRQQGSTNFLLPEQLAALVRAELEAGRRVILSWSDEMCFPDRNQGLDYSDWPFEPQLELRLFIGIEK